MRRRVVVVRVIASLLALAPLVVLILVSLAGDGLDPLPFAAADWRVGSARDRGRMVTSLQDRDLLIGMTPDEVEALLGPADRRALATADIGSTLVYVLDFGDAFISGVPWVSWLYVDTSTEDGRVYRLRVND